MDNEFFLGPDGIPERRVSIGTVPKRTKHFIRIPMSWHEALRDATGRTHYVAQRLLYLHWRQRGQPVKLANKLLGIEGVSRQAKWRALRDLERRGLIELERQPRRSPVIRLKNLSHF
jgi:hypothetical protein